MNERRMRLGIGLFVVLAGVLLAAMVVMFGSAPTLFKRTKTYTVRFSDAPGVSPGTPVRRSGVRIGTVREVELDDERGIVRVKVAIDPPHTLRNNEVPTLVVGLLGSDASIDFIPKPTEDGAPLDRGLVEPGSELVGIRAVNVGTLLSRASEVVPTTQETLNDMRKSMQRLEKLAARIEKLTPVAEETMREYTKLAKQAQKTLPAIEKTNNEFGELARSARQTLPELQRTNEEVRELSRSVRETVPELRETNKQVGGLAKDARAALPDLQRTNEEVRELARSVRETVPTVRATTEDVGAAARRMTSLAETLDVLVQENRKMVVDTLKSVNEASGRANRALNDENLKNLQATLINLRSASEAMPSLTKNTDETMKEARVTVRRLNETLPKIDALVTDLQRIARPVGDRSDRISKNLDESLEKLNAVLGDARALMSSIDRANGTFRRLLTDPSVYNNLDAAVAGLPRMVPRLERILKDFETFADKLARHPELLGVRGAVAPGSGLKSPPTPPIMPGGAPGPVIYPHR